MKTSFTAAASNVLAAALLLTAGAALAQPNYASKNQFGDRQSGTFGDPSQGHFGNASEGHFDNARMTEPAPGTQGLGKVYAKPAAETAEYISLPAPEAAEPAEAALKPTAIKQKKKRARKTSAP